MAGFEPTQRHSNSGRADLTQFLRGIIPVVSLADEEPDLAPVIVPPAVGARWGAPSELRFRVEGTPGIPEAEEPPETSGAVVDRNELIKRHGHEVTTQVKDPKTGDVVIEPYTRVCFVGRIIRKREERKPLPGGIAVKVVKITEIVDRYVDANTWCTKLPADQILSGFFVNDTYQIVEG